MIPSNTTTRQASPSADHSVRVLHVPAAGNDTSVTIRLHSPATSQAVVPVLLWLTEHTPTAGTSGISDAFHLAVVRDLGVAVASVEYRPNATAEHSTPLQQCHAALQHVFCHGSVLGLDTSSISIGGRGHGGGLAAGLSQMARDENTIPIAFVLLEVPNLDSESHPLTPADAVAAWQYFIGNSDTQPSATRESRYEKPSHSTALSGLPATYISTLELDPLHDGGRLRYATALTRAGVSVELHAFAQTPAERVPVTPSQVQEHGAETIRRSLPDMLAALHRALFVHSRAGSTSADRCTASPEATELTPS